MDTPATVTPMRSSSSRNPLTIRFGSHDFASGVFGARLSASTRTDTSQTTTSDASKMISKVVVR